MKGTQDLTDSAERDSPALGVQLARRSGRLRPNLCFLAWELMTLPFTEDCYCGRRSDILGQEWDMMSHI